jgi:intein/homing endonuclease
VKELVKHTAENYAITRLLVMHAVEQEEAGVHMVTLSGKVLEATPNHPVLTIAGKKQMGTVATGDQLLCMDEHTKTLVTYTVVNKTEAAGGKQPVYNIVAEGGDAFMMNNIMVLQK